jgi:multisubunit Na+/H+ antiporter MnhC subunit
MKLREAQMHKMCVTVVFKNCYLKYEYIKLRKVIALPLLLHGYGIGYFTLGECKNYTCFEVILKQYYTKMGTL